MRNVDTWGLSAVHTLYTVSTRLLVSLGSTQWPSAVCVWRGLTHTIRASALDRWGSLSSWPRSLSAMPSGRRSTGIERQPPTRTRRSTSRRLRPPIERAYRAASFTAAPQRPTVRLDPSLSLGPHLPPHGVTTLAERQRETLPYCTRSRCRYAVGGVCVGDNCKYSIAYGLQPYGTVAEEPCRWLRP